MYVETSVVVKALSFFFYSLHVSISLAVIVSFVSGVCAENACQKQSLNNCVFWRRTESNTHKKCVPLYT